MAGSILSLCSPLLPEHMDPQVETPLQVGIDELLFSFVSRRDNKLLLPLLLTRKLLFQGFLFSPFPQARIWMF